MYTLRVVIYNLRVHEFLSVQFRLAECRYKVELTLISCSIYSLISDPTKTDQCVQDKTVNVCMLLRRLGPKKSRVFKYFLLIEGYSGQLNIKCSFILSLPFYNDNKATIYTHNK